LKGVHKGIYFFRNKIAAQDHVSELRWKLHPSFKFSHVPKVAGMT
jgi:hypothetical protein